MIGVLLIAWALTSVVVCVTIVVAREAAVIRSRRRTLPLHPSVRRAIVDQPRGESVTLIRPALYDWDADDAGGPGDAHG